jgi:hypothetical protein
LRNVENQDLSQEADIFLKGGVLPLDHPDKSEPSIIEAVLWVDLKRRHSVK